MSAQPEKKERTIAAGEFKAKCLKLLDEVAETGVSLVITKRGKVCARLGPLREEVAKSTFIGMTPGIVIHGDIVGPIFGDYEPPEFPE